MLYALAVDIVVQVSTVMRYQFTGVANKSRAIGHTQSVVRQRNTDNNYLLSQFSVCRIIFRPIIKPT